MLSNIQNLTLAYGAVKQDRAWNIYDLFDHLKVGFPGLSDLENFDDSQPLLYSMYGWRIGSLGMVAGEHSAIFAQGGNDHSGMSMTLLYEGCETYQQADLIHARPLEGAVLLNEEPAWAKTEKVNSIGIYFSPKKLIQTVEIMSSDAQVAIDLRPRYVLFKPFMISQVAQLPSLLASLKLYPNDAEDTVYRFIARLLVRDDFTQKKSTIRQVVNRESIDRACAFMRERVADDITLTEVERISGLSARVLQLAFKKRFGCGPKSWLTQLRLELVYSALLQKRGKASVAEIAERYGFRHMGRFAGLFKSRFGHAPSQAVTLH